MTETLKPRATARAFLEKDGRYLAILAKWCGKWTLPGGGIDGTDTVEQTIQRELEEELGYVPDIEDIECLGFCQGAQYYPKGDCNPPKLHILCKVPVKEEFELHLDPEEILDHKWVTLEEFKSLDLEDGYDDFFRRFPEALK